MMELQSPRRMAAIAAVVGLFGLIAAGPAVGSTIRHDGDYLPYNSAFDSVGQFYGSTTSYNFAASGVLIGNDWVLTAAHVVDGATALNFNIGGSNYSVDVANNVYVHSGWTGNVIDAFDIALVQLSTAVTNVTAATLNTRGNEAGKTGIFTGYGLAGDGLNGYDTSSSLSFRAVENTIDVVTSDNVLLADFDNPLSQFDNIWGSATPLDSEGSIAPGDSGGGMFLVDKRGRYSLAGINSFIGAYDGQTDADYGDIMGVTRVSAFSDWISGITGLGGGGGKPGKAGGGNGHSGHGTALGVLFIPEPATGSLLLIGGALMLHRRKR